MKSLEEIKEESPKEIHIVEVRFTKQEYELYDALRSLLNYKDLEALLRSAVSILDEDIADGFRESSKLHDDDEFFSY